jgi:ISXO2 transposase-like protein
MAVSPIPRLRASLHDPDFQQLMGIVEVDEMYHGGKAQNMHAKKRKERDLVGTKGKATVIGAISRKGSVVCQMIENTDTATLDSFVRNTVNREKVELIATDEDSGYRLLGLGGNAFGLPHLVCHMKWYATAAANTCEASCIPIRLSRSGAFSNAESWVAITA